MPQAQAQRAKAQDSEDATHSGRLLLRMPPSLHAELARAAEREGVSLNAYITRALTDLAEGSLGESSGSPERGEGERPDPAPERGRGLIRAAIVADLVLVAIAAAVAIALLIVAWP